MVSQHVVNKNKLNKICFFLWIISMLPTPTITQFAPALAVSCDCDLVTWSLGIFWPPLEITEEPTIAQHPHPTICIVQCVTQLLHCNQMRCTALHCISRVTQNNGVGYSPPQTNKYFFLFFYFAIGIVLSDDFLINIANNYWVFSFLLLQVEQKNFCKVTEYL